MSTSNIIKALREFGRAPIADARSFERLIVLPQIFVFIAYISVGAALHEPPSASILKLATVGYLVLVNMVVQSSLNRFSARLLAFHIAALALLLSLSCLVMSQPSLPNVFVPMSIVMLVLSLAPLSWSSALTVCAGAATVLGVFWLAELLINHQWWYQDTRGPLLACCSFFMLLLKTLARPPRPAGFSGLGPSSPPGRSRGASGGYQSKSAGITADGLDDGSQTFLEELRADFFRRLLIASLAFSVLMLVVNVDIFSQSMTSRAAAAVLLFVQIVLLYRQRIVTRLRTLYLNALSIVAVEAGWVALSVVHSSVSEPRNLLGLSLLILSFGSLPWPTALAIAIPCIVFVTAFLLDLNGPQAGVLLLVVLGSGSLSLSSALLAHHALSLRATLLHLRRVIEVGISSAPLVRLVSERLVSLLNVGRALLVGAGEHAEILGAESAHQRLPDPVFVQGLEERIASLHVDDGIVSSADLGEQFLPALTDWFEFIPRRLLFFRARAVVDGIETIVLLVVPVSVRIELLGVERLFRSAVSVFTVVRGALSATRSRFLSSDVLLESQRSVAEREQELGQVVHLVNNIAQDLTIQCEALGRTVGNDGAVQEKIRLIETLARNLSAGVSDIKLQRELVRLAIGERSDDLDVEVFMEELRLYGRYRDHRRGDKFNVINEVPAQASVRVISREFLETGVRSLLRCSVARMEPGGSVEVRAVVKDGNMCLTVQDSGRPGDYVGEQSSSGREIGEREAQFFSSLLQLATRSGGTLKVCDPGTGFTNAFELTLPIHAAAGKLKIEQGHWALLVDDNVQVTTFYSRVAEALNLKYFSAASVQEAEARISEHGRPRIVITDIQLGSGSGLDLVRSLRAQFGDGLPVIVVSGHTAEALAEQVSAAGATKYLVKPVGRAKLFSEIRALLSS